ncbi:ABC transporter ATP-binding protein [Bacillus alkalicellulosilyticus]|uniref:ABC transporter ATP-binding protein n=1 Tax=Alkalihalobacterium alkalicellulosilyticum TaxID=1912214 RepID=UPI000996499C|nr:ABC transporter ATP-binding protein [Bacillus alkalicellulosilyticus]
MNVIKCENLTKCYGKLEAIQNMTFSIEENKITGLIGRNGAGKTTLLKTIAGYYQSSSGRVQVLSKDPFNNLEVTQNMIFVDDKMSFPPLLYLGDILNAAADFYENWNEELARGLFEYFSLSRKAYHEHLSKGMKSTFNMIIGIAARCPLTMFDEPTSGMDAAVRKDFYRALLKDYLQHPRTIVLSSHLVNEIEDILEDILLIKEGEVLLHLEVDELKKYAVGLRGKNEIVEKWVEGHEIIYQESFGVNQSYHVVRNLFNESTIEQIKKSGVEVTAVDVNDLCVYLTARQKGGIDDVFNKQ